MLHEFLSSNRDELIRRCRLKVGKRFSPPVTASVMEQGVPLFLEQLIDALRLEKTQFVAKHDGIPGNTKSPAAIEGSRTSALNGKELLRSGYSVEEVVHGYGDVCQAITELAAERNATVTIQEFHTFNRLLDNAIADAVSSYGEDLYQQLGTLADEQRTLVDRALKAWDALKIGNVGVMGVTGSVLEDTLMKLRGLVDRSRPEVRLSSGMTPDRRSP